MKMNEDIYTYIYIYIYTLYSGITWQERIAFMARWLHKGPPVSFWVGALRCLEGFREGGGLVAMVDLGMGQYLLIPFLGGWTSIYQLFWCSPGVQGFDKLPFHGKTPCISGWWLIWLGVPPWLRKPPYFCGYFLGLPLMIYRPSPGQW